jgi:hypothetical protein
VNKLWSITVHTDDGWRTYIVEARSPRHALNSLLQAKPGLNDFSHITFEESNGEIIDRG